MPKGLIAIIVILIVVIAAGAYLSFNYQRSTPATACDASPKPFAYTAEPNFKGPPPDTYVVNVKVTTTSHWTSVAVNGAQSVTDAGYVTHNESDGNKNVDVEGLNVYELSQPERVTAALPTITAQYDAIVQPAGSTIIFQIDKGSVGTTTYTLSTTAGNATKEIAQFVHNGAGGAGENVRTFRLDPDLLPPVNFPSAAETYDGPLFDAHLHLNGSDSAGSGGVEDDKLFINPKNADKFFAMMDNLGVTSLIGFLPINHENFVAVPRWTDPFLKQTQRVANRHCDRIFPFLFPDSLNGIISRQYFNTELIDEYVNRYPFPIRGIGEIHVDQENPLYADIRLNDQEMLDLYDYAAANNLVVMIHPRESDLADLDQALSHNPKAIILLHGDEGIEKIIPALLAKHQNLYYSIDAGLMYPYSLPIADMTKQQFLNNLSSEDLYYRLLASALNYWQPLIEAHPDRIMWGTDALQAWHFEPEVYSEVTWFARDFIGGLDPAVQEKFGYQNAERMLFNTVK